MKGTADTSPAVLISNLTCHRLHQHTQDQCKWMVTCFQACYCGWGLLLIWILSTCLKGGCLSLKNENIVIYRKPESASVSACQSYHHHHHHHHHPHHQSVGKHGCVLLIIFIRFKAAFSSDITHYDNFHCRPQLASCFHLFTAPTHYPTQGIMRASANPTAGFSWTGCQSITRPTYIFQKCTYKNCLSKKW